MTFPEPIVVLDGQRVTWREAMAAEDLPYVDRLENSARDYRDMVRMTRELIAMGAVPATAAAAAEIDGGLAAPGAGVGKFAKYLPEASAIEKPPAKPEPAIEPTDAGYVLKLGIRESLEALMAPGQVFEIRAFREGRVNSGYFDNAAAAAVAVDPLDGLAEGIYFTPNPVNPALLARRANRIKPSMGRDSSTADVDIIARRWLLVDIDPVRPSGVSSTDDEHRAAMGLALEIAEALELLGWPDPVIGDSGNGAHLLYRIDLPNDDESTALVKGTLAALDRLFSTDQAKVDTGVFNPSRIWKAYGTVAKKGDSIASRPHRRSGLVAVPDALAPVTRQQLEIVAAKASDRQPAEPKKAASSRTPGEALDLGKWLRDHQIGVASEKPYQGGTLYKLETCPFSGDHSDGAFAIQFENGAIHAGCQHDSCGSRRQRWQELREMVEGAKKSRARRSTAPPASSTAGGTPEVPEAVARFTYRLTSGAIRIDDAAVAEFLYETLNVVSFNGSLFIYADGMYRPDKGTLSAEVKKIVQVCGTHEQLTKVWREVHAHLLATNPFKTQPFNLARDLIPAKNGVVAIDYETGSATLLPHSPGYRFTFKLPVVYDEAATVTMAEDLFAQYVLPEDVPILVQPFAQALLQAQMDRTYKKNYLLQGNKNAGKSTYTVILEGFFGEENISHVALQGLTTDRFCNGRMENKLINYYDDLSNVPLEQIGRFKALTGSTIHDIERKFEGSYPGRIFCPHVFTCNRPPRVSDLAKTDDAWWERWEYVRFPYSFPVDPLFYERTLTPAFYSSLLAAAIAMMIEIRQRGDLTVNRTSAEVQERWSLTADPLCQFIDAKMNRLEATISDFDKAKLHTAYLEWCRVAEIPALLRISTLTAFTQALQGYGIHEIETSTTIDGVKRKYHVYRGGYRWKDPNANMGHDYMASRWEKALS
ncbi:MAG: DUF5906 domain-containing protein [Methanospirillum sp.]